MPLGNYNKEISLKPDSSIQKISLAKIEEQSVQHEPEESRGGLKYPL